MAAWNSLLRPYWSPSLPHSGVAAVVAEQVRGDHPGQVVQPAEVADDRGQRGRDDGLVERGEQHAEHQRR